MKLARLHIVIIALLFFNGNNIFAQAPFSCSNGASYQLRGNPSAFYSVNLRTGAANQLFSASQLGNRLLGAIGYNPADNLIYGWVENTSNIFKLGSDGVLVEIPVAGINVNGRQSYTGGDVTVIGGIPFLFITDSGSGFMLKINLNDYSWEALGTGGIAAGSDIAISPDGTRIYSSSGGILYSWSTSGVGNGTVTTTGGGGPCETTSTFIDSNGDLFLCAANVQLMRFS